VGAARVFLVPDGALSLVSFEALPDARAGYLLQSAPPIHYLSAERDLASPPAAPRATPRGLLVVGGPSFDDAAGVATEARVPRVWPGGDEQPALPSLRDAPASCGSFQRLRFQPLAGTLQEVREISRIWPQSDRGESARVLVGRQASERTFKQDAHRYRILHLATHGFFLDQSCSPAPSGTRGVGGLAGGARAVENPLLLSGLALAGANRRDSAGPDQDDGFLTAEEVASLNLDVVEWAVLSACDTGVGEIKAGEGVFGLRRAFQVAGARTVVMSLWSVDDQATRAWMRALYEGRFQKQLSTADAVHNASLTVLSERRARGESTHPFYWAAFVAAGDWR
jgi:CHAT domain-containing protein